METSKLPLFACLLALVSAPAVRAGSVNVVTTRASLPADETTDWSGFGPEYTDVNGGSTLTTMSGLVVTVSESDGMQIRQEGSGFTGNFLPGQCLLTNWNSPSALTISFSSPIFGAGVQIEPAQVQDLPAPFTASVSAYDGSILIGQFSTTGTRSSSQDGSAPFLGVMGDTAEITSLTYRAVAQTNGPTENDLAMNFLSLETSAPVPEPSPFALVTGGLVFALFVSCQRALKHQSKRWLTRYDDALALL